MHKYNNKLTNFARLNRRSGNLAEALLWNELKQSKLGYRFTKQKPIGNYIADFYCPEKKLVIEIDGSQHYVKEGRDKDIERDEYLEKLGVKVLRYSNYDVNKNFEAVCKDILKNIERVRPSSVRPLV